MFGKMMFLAAAAAVLPLAAAPVFELKFDGNTPNWKGCNNFSGRCKIENKPFEGAKMATVFTNKDPKATKGDTSISVLTPNFKVAGKKFIRIEGEVYSTIDLKDTSGNGTRNSVVLVQKGKTKLVPFTIRTPKKEFTPFTATVPVTKDMDEVYVQLGYDNPDLLGNNVFAVKSLKVSVE